MRHAKPYLFYGQTTSTCEDCLALVPAKIIVENDNVFYLKRCATHGVQKTEIASDFAYYKSTKDYLKPGDKPLTVASTTHYGCPYDCGLCPDHEQHSCLALIEINEHCNLSCPVCFAESSPERPKHRPLAEITAMMDALVKAEGEPDLLQISGGEPTLHPDILTILAEAKNRPIRHLMLNTNGIRIAKEPEFVAALAQFMPGFEIYLQFDSLERDALMALRGADLRAIHDQALANLEAAGISTTLVCTVKKGINDADLGAVIRHGLRYKCVRGVTFQPVQATGRNENFNKERDRALLTDIRRVIGETSGIFAKEDIIPLPCNPDGIAIGYGLRQGDQVMPVTQLMPRDELVREVPNAIVFEQNPELKQRIFDLFSLSCAGENTGSTLHSLLCCLPQVEVPPSLGYENIFRVVIVQFLDKYNFCLSAVKRSCIHFVTPDGRIIPFDTYNMFYRDGLDVRLRPKMPA